MSIKVMKLYENIIGSIGGHLYEDEEKVVKLYDEDFLFSTDIRAFKDEGHIEVNINYNNEFDQEAWLCLEHHKGEYRWFNDGKYYPCEVEDWFTDNQICEIKRALSDLFNEYKDM